MSDVALVKAEKVQDKIPKYNGIKAVKEALDLLGGAEKFIKKEIPQVKEVYFQDDTLPKDRAIEISEAIIENKLKIRWSSYSRADLDLKTLKLMRKSGCRILETGFESSNPQILKNICTGLTSTAYGIILVIDSFHICLRF